MPDPTLANALKRVGSGTFFTSTLAKDIAVLDPEYKVEYMQPVDMFPQTAHVEVVSELVLRSGAGS
ncbi:hypothetical protein [Bacillus infantis]|uniref:Uncharacterized protein n=1 Tax=Bacillus infantis TaxID=324767 RepID=A0A5D4RN30_9BACI|nr:hypothetical protein FZD51_03715 [Bacillus infantis]